MTDAATRRIGGSTQRPGPPRAPGHRRAGPRGGAPRRPPAGRGAGRSASTRWAAYLEPLPDRLRDDEPAALRRDRDAARAAYGAKDSVRDALPARLTEPFLDAIDRLLTGAQPSQGMSRRVRARYAG